MYKCTEYVMICVGSTNQSECVVCYESNNHILSVKHAKNMCNLHMSTPNDEEFVCRNTDFAQQSSSKHKRGNGIFPPA